MGLKLAAYFDERPRVLFHCFTHSFALAFGGKDRGGRKDMAACGPLEFSKKG
jgi:hypothetical protein